MKTNNKKNIILTGAIFLLLITVLTACSKENNKTEAINADTKDPTAEEILTEEPSTEELLTEEPATEESAAEASVAEASADTKAPVTGSGNQQTVSGGQGTAEFADAEKTNEETAANKVVTAGNLGTPQEYKGDPEGRGPGRIIVKGFDYDKVGWKGVYWTASNGVEIKVIEVDGRATGMIAVLDGKGKDIEHNSPFQVACAEAEGTNLNKYNADLNVTIPLAPYKRTEIDINDKDLVAYRDAYDYKLWRNNGVAEFYTPYKYGEPINMRYAVASDGIGEFDGLGAIFWRITRENDYWKVKINANLAEFRWDGIHQALRYLSPDGDTLYQVIYEDCYFGSPTILEYDEWFAVGNSQIYQPNPDSRNASIYYFK